MLTETEKKQRDKKLNLLKSYLSCLQQPDDNPNSKDLRKEWNRWNRAAQNISDSVKNEEMNENRFLMDFYMWTVIAGFRL